MPVTAPVINGTPTYKRLSWSWVDVSEDVKSDSLIIRGDATVAEINAAIVALGGGSNANLWKVGVEDVYTSLAAASAANTGTKSDSVHDVINVQFKDVTANNSQRAVVRAPIGALLVGDSDTPDKAATEMSDIVTAVDAILPAAYGVVGYRYTERREINEQVKA